MKSYKMQLILCCIVRSVCDYVLGFFSAAFCWWLTVIQAQLAQLGSWLFLTAKVLQQMYCYRQTSGEPCVYYCWIHPIFITAICKVIWFLHEIPVLQSSASSVIPFLITCTHISTSHATAVNESIKTGRPQAPSLRNNSNKLHQVWHCPFPLICLFEAVF